MTLSADSRNSEVIVTPPTEIDMASGELLARRIRRAGVLCPDRVIVDFGMVTFCDSTAVMVLVSSRRALEAQGCALVIRNPSRMLQRVAGVLGQSQSLGIPEQVKSRAVDHG